MQVRKDLGVSEDVKLLLFNFGGQVFLLNKFKLICIYRIILFEKAAKYIAL